MSYRRCSFHCNKSVSLFSSNQFVFRLKAKRVIVVLISGYNNPLKWTGSTKIGKPISYYGSYNVGMTHRLKLIYCSWCSVSITPHNQFNCSIFRTKYPICFQPFKFKVTNNRKKNCLSIQKVLASLIFSVVLNFSSQFKLSYDTVQINNR